MTKYILVRFGEVSDDDLVCVDLELSDSDKLAYIYGLNHGLISEEDFLWFGHKDDYFGCSPQTWVIMKVKQND